MLLILVLKKLAKVAEGLGTLRAVIRVVRNSGSSIAFPVGKKGNVGHVAVHRSLSRGELINLAPCIISSAAARAVTGLHMLDCASAGAKPRLTADWTRDAARAMDLHMHVKVVLVVECAIAFMTLVHSGHVSSAISSIAAISIAIVSAAVSTTTMPTTDGDTLLAPRDAITLSPLVRTKPASLKEFVTLAAGSSHIARFENLENGLNMVLARPKPAKLTFH